MSICFKTNESSMNQHPLPGAESNSTEGTGAPRQDRQADRRCRGEPHGSDAACRAQQGRPFAQQHANRKPARVRA